MIRITEEHYNWQCPIDEMLDGRSRMRTKSLFGETIQMQQVKNGWLPIYTLYDRDRDWTIPHYHPTRGGKKMRLVSAYLIYMSSIDDFDASIKLVGTSRHWETLCNLDWFANGQERPTPTRGLSDWREDMRLRDMSKAKKLLEEAAEEGNVAAAKALYQESKNIKGPGRPKKKKNDVEDDFDEINKIYKNVIEMKK